MGFKTDPQYVGAGAGALIIEVVLLAVEFAQFPLMFKNKKYL